MKLMVKTLINHVDIKDVFKNLISEYRFRGDFVKVERILSPDGYEN